MPIRYLMLLLLMYTAACQPQPSAPSQDPAVRQQERTTLPNVTAVQKWNQISTISEQENSAPSIIPLDNGDYRVYWNAPSLNGIGSATTPDGLRFNVDSNARIINAPAGQPDCAIGKPWVIQMAEGYRMYYQGQPENCNAAVTTLALNSRIFSAFSTDGHDFTRDPGIRIDVGSSGLTAAGHGRVIQTDDGTFRMYFTALLPDKGNTPHIMTAVSVDSLNWQVAPTPLLENAADPTALQIESTIYLYVSYMTANTLLLESTDSVNFTPTAWLEFYDSQNNSIVGINNIDIIDVIDGSLVIYGSGTGINGIATFKQAATS